MVPTPVPRPPGPDREQALVELVDPAGRRVGAATAAHAHAPPGLRHRAFSVLLLSPDRGRLLLQRRAAGKTRFPLRWANACCGHPAPDEPVTTAAARRLAGELRVTGLAVAEIGVWCYRADDPDSGAVEHEYDHVLLGQWPPERPLDPDPGEVAALRWVGPAELSELLATRPAACAPWLAGVVGALAAATGPPWLRSGGGPSGR
jgi:isopentenyl-diphosphate delta-isomerase